MAEEKKKEKKEESGAATSNLVERATAWIWIIGFGSTAAVTGVMSMMNSPWTWVPALVLVCEIAGGLAFMFSGDNARGLKVWLAIFFWVVGTIAFVNAMNALCNGIYQVGMMAKNWLDFTMSVQPDMQSKVVGGSLVLEMALPVVVGVVGYLVLYYWLGLTDKKFAVAIAFVLYALSRGQLEVFLVAVLLGMGLIRILKKLLKGAAKDAVQKAKDEGRWNFAIGFGAVSTIVIGLFFAQGTTWVTGLLVIFSEHPFTALSFIAQGTLVGGMFAIKI